MKKFFTYFFVTLGVIFFVLMCALSYIWFADPFNIRPMIDMLTSDTPVAIEREDATSAGTQNTPTTPSPNEAGIDKNPGLTAQQESALESIGINPANVPSSITPEMETCFTATLGAARVAEIKGGASPTPVEVFTTRECYQ